MIAVNNEPKKFSVLMVDDEKLNIDVLNHILKDRYKLYIAKSGENALKIAREHTPDLILLDIIMPDMDGFETLAKLKESELTQNIPIIFITGQDSKEDEVRGLHMGAVDYITKPFHNVIVDARIGIHMKIIEQMRTIERMSIMDELTDLPNRRYFNEQLANEWARATRETSQISAIVIDVDNFKRYNDTYGHPQGDVLLHTLAGIFRDSLMRPADFVARWGGEEFISIMPQTDLEGAMLVAERIRATVESTPIPCMDGMTKTTVSIGVHTARPTTVLPSAGFISKADKALYAAKAGGRNRVCAYEDGMM